MYAIEFNNVSKKYRKGEKVYALRDSIPLFFKGLFKKTVKTPVGDLKKNEFWAVKDVDFKVKKGEVLGIIGPNGAGKSTVLKLLSKITIPTKGNFKVRGRLSALIEVTAGFHPEFTGRENIYFNGAVLGMSKKELDSKFDDIVKFSGLDGFIDTPVKRYSSGMAARLGFAVAAHVDPEVLLVDEVLSVGDMTFQAKCTEKMRELLASGVTIIFISHNIPLVQSLCERVILLDQGKVLKDGLPEDVIPYYENLVDSRREQDLKEDLDSKFNLEMKDDALLEIIDIKTLDGDGKQKENFDSHESVSFEIEYDAHSEIVNPIFMIEIMRGDGVICCHSISKDQDFNMDKVEGKGKVCVHFPSTNLSPSVYYGKVTIWDKDMIHPYAISKRGVFKINTKLSTHYIGSVYTIDTSWEVKR